MTSSLPDWVELLRLDVLHGNKRNEGAFVLDHTVTATTRTADAVSLKWHTTLAAGGAPPAPTVTASFAPTPSTLLLATADADGGVSLTASALNPGNITGLTATATASPPSWGDGQVLLDYAHPAARISANLLGRGTKTFPLYSVAATVPLGAYLVGGGQVSGDAGAGVVTGWQIGAATTAYRGSQVDGRQQQQQQQQQQQGGVALTVGGSAALRAFGQVALDRATALGGEIIVGLPSLSRQLGLQGAKDAAPQCTLGVSHRTEAGALLKAKLDQLGIATLLYEGRLSEQARVAITAQFDATRPTTTAPRVGVLLDLSP